MKVYILTTLQGIDDGSYLQIEGVFATKELAEAAQKHWHPSYKAEVEEYEVQTA